MRAVLLLQCPDTSGIVATVGAFVADAGGNIVEADQHSDPAAGLFLQRIEFDVDATRDEVDGAFAPIAQRFSM
jgi:formyltetrahydrofolate deformylase